MGKQTDWSYHFVNIGTNSHAQIDTFISSAGSASGIATLDSSSKLTASQIPTLAESNITNLTTDLSNCEKTANKNVGGGYCGLDSNGLVPLTKLANGTYSNLADVSVVSIADDNIMVYNSTAGKWENYSISGATFNDSTKTITVSASTANNLASATTTVNVSSATAPSANQALIATSSTSATWQTLSSTSAVLSDFSVSSINNGYL